MSSQRSSEPTQPSRRSFVLATTGLTAGGWATLSSQAFGEQSSAVEPLIEPGDTVLFQGDSITDALRNRDQEEQPNHQAPMGYGYAWMASAPLLVSRPQNDLKIFNRGVGGDKVIQLADRWQEDCLDLQPNVLSVLVGVNDIWHKLAGDYDGTVEGYERDYHALMKRTKAALPKVKLVVCEPFVLRVGAVNDKWFPMFDGYRAAARRVAEAAGAVFVPFQTMFDKALEFAPPEHWSADGVHPSEFGHALMAHAWLQAVAG